MDTTATLDATYAPVPQPPVGALGLVLPTFPQDAASLLAPASLAATCRGAEDAGAGALWACDHLFWHRPALECLMALGAAAAATERAALGTCVLQLPLRSAAVVAKQAAALQHLCGGRLVLGLGVGNHEGEYEAAGARFASRGRDLDRGIDELRAAWMPGGALASGRALGSGSPLGSGDTPGSGSALGSGRMPGSGDTPGSASPGYVQLPEPDRVPIWIGGSSEAALARAARRGDGWIPLFLSPARYSSAMERLSEEASKAGRDPRGIARAVVIFASVGNLPDASSRGLSWMSSLYGLPPRAFARHLTAGPPRACADEIASFYEAGAEHVAVFLTDDEPLHAFEEIAAELAVQAPLAGAGCLDAEMVPVP